MMNPQQRLPCLRMKCLSDVTSSASLENQLIDIYLHDDVIKLHEVMATVKPTQFASSGLHISNHLCHCP